MEIENLIGLDILDVLCEKFSYDTTGYSIIILKFTTCYLEFTVEDSTDEIITSIKIKIDEMNLIRPNWSEYLKNKKLAQFWNLRNEKEYDDLICLGINELIPTLVFTTIASEIKVGFVDYTVGAQKEIKQLS